MNTAPRTALVTGATKNIGLAIAHGLAATGTHVVINGRDPDIAKRCAAEVTAAGGHALGIAADVTDPEAVQQMVADARNQVGPIEVLINNAVVRAHATIDDVTYQDWRRALDTTLDGAFHCTRAVLANMREQRWGRIVNLAGVSGQKGVAGSVALVTAKSAIIGFTKAVALDTAADGITVNAVAPGLIDTDRGNSGGGHADDRYARAAEEIPVGRMGYSHEVVAACRYLCSDDAAYVTGQTLAVNGGVYLH